MRHVIIAIATLALALSFSNVRAQERPSDKGTSLALRLSGGEFRATDTLTGTRISDVGGGLVFTAGYDFNRVFGLQLEFAGNGFSSLAPGLDATTGSLSILMQYRFLPDHFARPYLRAGLGGYSLGFNDPLGDVTVSGGTIPLGAGFEFGIARHFSLGIEVMHYIVSYDEVSVELSGVGLTYDVDADGSQTNFSLVTIFYF